MKPAYALILFAILILATSCSLKIAPTSPEVRDAAIDTCKSFCLQEKQNNTDLSNGPCISNSIIKDWVCDVAHTPRQSIDNSPENQCPAFREGIARHFVELDQECNLIRYK